MPASARPSRSGTAFSAETWTATRTPRMTATSALMAPCWSTVRLITNIEMTATSAFTTAAQSAGSRPRIMSLALLPTLLPRHDGVDVVWRPEELDRPERLQREQTDQYDHENLSPRWVAEDTTND